MSFAKNLFLIVSFCLTFLHHVSSCDEHCADRPVFTPSRLVVKFGDPTSAKCFVCQRECLNNLFDLEKSLGSSAKNGTTISWTVDRMTEWDTSAQCYYNNDTDYQCCTFLPITVYQPPDNVAISFVNHTGPMFEGHQYTLQCTVQDVAPVESLTVTFYRGQTALSQQQSNYNTEKTPVNEIFTLEINATKEDNGVQYWCEAELQLGPEGPQQPPVEISPKLTATVNYKPHLEGAPPPDSITVKKGNPLQLNCSVVGNPSPSYIWKPPSANASPSNSSIFTINSVTKEDEGLYTCSVSNAVGSFTVKIFVKVQVDYTIYIIGGIIIAVCIIALVLVMLYSHYYRNRRMGKYNLKDVFRFSKRHSVVPTVE